MILTRQLCARIHYTPPVPISNFLSAYLNGSVVNIFQKFQERCIWCCITWMLKKWIIWQNNSYLQPYQGKKVREKWLNSLQVTKFFPDFLFPTRFFHPDIFSPDKEFIRIIFFSYYYYYYYYFLFICKIYYYHVFFDVLYLSWLSKTVLTKISKCELKQGIEKITTTI